MFVKPIVRGLLSHVPPIERLISKGTGGTDSGRYCYTVWFRHLAMVHSEGLPTNPEVVAELGPGDSIGAGLAALLSGAQRLFALDVKCFAANSRNLNVLDELVELFRERADLPGDEEFPDVQPRLGSYGFPEQILSDSQLVASLESGRVSAIYDAVRRAGNGQSSEMITYRAPWDDAGVIREGTVDVAFSQAVLEHVTDIEATYRALFRWLKPGGVMTHQIDFKSHSITPEWNGHWAISDLIWKVIVGRRPYLLNRESASAHLQQIEAAGFRTVLSVHQRRQSEIPRDRLAKRFQHMDDRDFNTCGLFVVAVKPD